MLRWLLLLIFLPTSLMTVTACATMGGVKSPKSVAIEFKGKPGEATETRYYSNARILSYEQNQLLRDRTEGVDFTVATHVSAVDAAKKTIQFEARTIRKDGVVELHDLAFPELNEQIDFIVRSNGEVLKAGRLPPQSLFFVPSMPIPKGPVEVGDTWNLEHTWISSKEGIPLKLEVVGILKAIVSCEKNKTCADIEISGHVNLGATPTTPGARFESRLWGRMLFSVERGDVIWSDMRSREDMGTASDHVVVTSCMLSETKLSEKFVTDFACEPTEKPVEPEKIPRL